MGKITRKKLILLSLLAAVSLPNQAEEKKETIESLTKRIEQLEQLLKEAITAKKVPAQVESQLTKERENKVQRFVDAESRRKQKELEERIELLADQVEKGGGLADESRTKIGGYGELHYSALEADGNDQRELDFHRMVLFFGYEFNDWARFNAELEVEHIIASDGSRGAVELEQVYVEMDLTDEYQLKTGVMLMPLGIINETHEPTAFYGVERPIVEQTIIPTTWWSAGIGLKANYDNGLSFDFLVTEGLKTDDPASGPNADPFDIKGGKQKSSFADAFDLALTGRVKYTGVPGLELAIYGQYQPDLDQSALDSYAESATLLGGHAIYQWNELTFKALYARWDLDGPQAFAAGKEIQDGGYAEMAWRANEQWGFFARHSLWSQEARVEKAQSLVGLNYYPFEQVVFKLDYQIQNEDAGNVEGLKLGFGYHF